MTRIRSAVLVLLLLFFLTQVHQAGDTWLGLRVSHDTLRGVPIYKETYSWTAAGNYNPHHSWVWGLATYGLYVLGSNTLWLVYILMAAMLTLPFALAVPPPEVREKLSLDKAWLGLLFLPVIPALAFLGSIPEVRAQGVSFTFFALLLFLLTRQKYVFVPPLFLAWSWLHAGFLTGLVALAVTFVASMVFLLIKKDRESFVRARSIVLTGVLSGLATLFNPMGINMWKYLYDNLAKAQNIPIIEFQRAWVFPSSFNLWILVTLATIGAILVLRRHLVHWPLALSAVLALFFSLLGLWVIRFIPFALICALPLLACIKGPNIVEIKLSKLYKGMERALPALVAVVSVAAVFILNNKVSTENEWAISGELKAQLSLCDRAYNDYFSGAYLLWYYPSHRVFQDNRWDPYPEDVVRYTDLTSENWESALEDWNPDCVFTTAGSPTDVTAGEKGWTPAYRDPHWVLWTRSPRQ